MAKVGKQTFFGWNSYKTHPKLSRIKSNGFGIACYHAETHVLYKVPKHKRRKAKIFVSRLKKGGGLTMSKPCEHCLQTLLNEGVLIKNIWYTDHDGRWLCLKNEIKT